MEPITQIKESDNQAKVVYLVDSNKNYIFKEFNSKAESIENIKAGKLIGKKLLDIFPGAKDFGLIDVVDEVYTTGKSKIHPINHYKDDKRIGWRRNFVIKSDVNELTVWYQDVTNEYNYHQSE